MGLAAPRKRRKISQDPNNTAWAHDTNTYGQKILAAQGWTPGSFLGARDAPHSAHYSAANASHIRILLKDDNLGLGASRKRAEDQGQGLGVFQDLLGRLNGKSELQIEKEQLARADIGRRMYAEQKYGPARFVRGGFLVGDRIEETKPVENVVECVSSKSDSKDAKRKAGREHKVDADVSDDQATESKAERRRRREERRARKKAKVAKRGQAEAAKQDTAVREETTTRDKEGDDDVPPGQQRQQGPSTSRPNVRRKYLEQKRKSGMDPQALREILMVKTQG